MEATLPQVLIFSTVGGVFSLIGGLILLKFGPSDSERVSLYIAPFAAGALLAAAFTDLLKESAEGGHYSQGLAGALFGIILFFILERFFSWFHHHHSHEDEVMKDPKIHMVIVGDTLHNLIDGLAMGAAFLVNPQVGIITALAVAAHEIPQEIGDFGLLLSKGMSKRRVALINIISALVSVFGACLVFLVGKNSELNLSPLLGLVAGMFIYIAVSDIIPEIHHKSSKKLINLSTLMLVLGVVLVSVLSASLHHG